MMGLAAFNRMRREAEEKRAKEAASKLGNDTPAPDPRKLSTAALKAELAARQIEVPEGAKKADLVALLEAALAAEGSGHD